jgi:cell division protein FtsW
VCALLTFGLVMVYSASFILAQERSGDGFSFVKKQLVFALIGMIGLIATLRVSIEQWKKYSLHFFGVSLFLLILVLIPGVGVRVGGAQRWINFGLFNLQPAEVAKFAAILFIARQMDKKRESLQRFVPGIIAPFVGPLFLMLFLMIQPDFGSTVMITAVGFGLLLLGGVRKRYLFSIVTAGISAGMFLILIAPYRRARLITFLDPWQDPLGKGFQVLQSMLALHNGGVLGTGLGNGKEKLFYLPEAHNDFIFAVIGEELGFIGVIAVVAAYTFFIYRGLKISYLVFERTNDLFRSLLAAGITLLLGIQGYVNMGVVLGILPTKGLTLPFVSYGGSALIIDLAMVGILLRISKGLFHSSTHTETKSTSGSSSPILNEA